LTSKFDEYIGEQDAASTRRVLDLITSVAHINDELKPLETAKKFAVDQIKQHMALAGEKFLRDPETGASAKITERKGTPTYDVVSLVSSQGGIDALIKAANAGMVRIDHTMLSRFRKDSGAAWADALAQYEMPGTGTEALTVYMEEK
jgi:hypothetical protein